MRKLQPETANLLNEIYLHFANAPLVLREKVCHECAMSTPTFYRKMRVGDAQRQSLSNAEKEGIIKIASEVVKSMEDLLCKYKGNPDHKAS